MEKYSNKTALATLLQSRADDDNDSNNRLNVLFAHYLNYISTKLGIPISQYI